LSSAHNNASLSTPAKAMGKWSGFFLLLNSFWLSAFHSSTTTNHFTTSVALISLRFQLLLHCKSWKPAAVNSACVGLPFLVDTYRYILNINFECTNFEV
jgi:hypothetical protein